MRAPRAQCQAEDNHDAGIPPPSWSSFGLEGSGPLQQDTQGPRDLALAFLTASLFVMSPFGNTCF